MKTVGPRCPPSRSSRSVKNKASFFALYPQRALHFLLKTGETSAAVSKVATVEERRVLSAEM